MIHLTHHINSFDKCQCNWSTVLHYNLEGLIVFVNNTPIQYTWLTVMNQQTIKFLQTKWRYMLKSIGTQQKLSEWSNQYALNTVAYNHFQFFCCFFFFKNDWELLNIQLFWCPRRSTVKKAYLKFRKPTERKQKMNSCLVHRHNDVHITEEKKQWKRLAL